MLVEAIAKPVFLAGGWGRALRAHRNCRAVVLLILLLTGSSSSGSVCAQEWTRFRGPNGSGLSEATTVPTRWNESDFNWKVKLPGIGHSSPVLWGKKIFITAGLEKEGTKIVTCLHADDGRLLWSKRFQSKTHRKHQLNSFASSTPAVDGKRLYLSWASPEEHLLQALDHEGNELWKVDLGPFKSSHGAGVSPIVFNDMVIVGNEHQGDSSLVAVDCRTGRIRWQAVRDTKVAYITPCIFRRKDSTAELIFTNWEPGITAIDPATGKTNWEISVFDQKHVESSIGSPIVVGDLVLGTCGYLGYANQTVAVRPDDAHPKKVREVFRFERGAPLTTTPVATEDLLFLWADEGIVTCANTQNGKVHWRKRVGGTFYGSPVVVNDAVYCLSTDGKAIVLEASKQYRLIARNRIGEGSHSTPAVADGVMYLRTFSHLISIGRRKER